MQNNKTNDASFAPDRMGRFIGQLRIHEGITLSQLSHGLCSVPFLNRIENGEREVGKQMTDAFFQRLGKPVELFERILDWEEFQQWSRRQEIIASIRKGDIHAARSGIQNYLSADSDVLDQQFTKIIEINCCHLSCAGPKDILPMVCDALALTQPDFQSTSVENLLLSQNEGRLLFAYLQLKEQLEGFDAVSDSYNALLHYFKNPRYESRERVYLVPYVACRVIENDYNRGRYMSALTVCEDTLEELTKEKRLFSYDRLLEWKQKLYDAIGNADKTPWKLFAQLELIQAYAPKQAELLIPCDERGHVYCLNQVIRDRRKLLGISQEALAEGICEPRTLSRIETHGGSVHRKNRKLLLQRVNMSGERYDYEVISDRYEAYLLRSDVDRAVTENDLTKSTALLSNLRRFIPDSQTNIQYILKTELEILASLPNEHHEKLSLTEQELQWKNILNLTLPLDMQSILTCPTCVLSINETLTLIALAFCYKRQGYLEKSLDLLTYIDNCFKSIGTNSLYYEGLYTRVIASIASVTGDLKQYDESDVYALTCIKLSLENRNARQIAHCLYGIAWNRIQQLSNFTGTERKHRENESIAILKQAYAAALISGNDSYKRLINNYHSKVYGTEIDL